MIKVYYTFSNTLFNKNGILCLKNKFEWSKDVKNHQICTLSHVTKGNISWVIAERPEFSQRIRYNVKYQENPF